MALGFKGFVPALLLQTGSSTVPGTTVPVHVQVLGRAEVDKVDKVGESDEMDRLQGCPGVDRPGSRG